MGASIDRGPIDAFVVIWNNGTVERVRAHQVSTERGEGIFDPPTRINFHGEVDGHWKLMLSVPYDEIRTVRNITQSLRAEAE